MEILASTPSCVSNTPVASCSIFRRLTENSDIERAMSEAAICSAAVDPAATPLRPSTPHHLSRPSSQNHQCCAQSEDAIVHHTAQGENGCFERIRPQFSSVSLQFDHTRAVRTLVMRGVITGPARWRGSNVSCGTPNLYCAVYKYSFTEGVVYSSDSSAQSANEWQNSLPLPPPTLVSSTWGQGPLVIEGVPVLERHANTRDEGAGKGSLYRDDELQSIFVLAIGVFRSRLASNSSTPVFSDGVNHRKNASTPPPRPNDLLGVLHVPLHCVNITERQQEVKLRLPVTHLSPNSKNHAGLPGQIEAEGEQELAAVLSPTASLETLEKHFVDGLSASTTGANRCNVMLFRLSGSGGSFLPTSDAILQAALAAPASPSIASTTLQRSVNPCEPQDNDKRTQRNQCPNGPQAQQDATKAETLPGNEAPYSSNSNLEPLGNARAVGGCRHDAPISHEQCSNSAATPTESSGKDVGKQLVSPSRRQQTAADIARSTASVASNHLPTEQQRQRHQRRQQELSVAAVLAASAIAAAARGERDRSSRSSTSKKPQQSQRLVSGLGLRSTQRPSSVCGVVASNRTFIEQQNSGNLSLHSHSVSCSRTRVLQERWAPAAGKTTAERTTEFSGEPELSPDDSVSVRGDDTHRLAATLANSGAKSAHSVASCMPIEGLVPLDSSVRLPSLSDDRKSTLTTSIRRLDCLMTRAQLLLSQRRHRQQQQGEYRLAPSHESILAGRAEQREITPVPQAALNKPLKNQHTSNDNSQTFATEGRGSIQTVPAKEVEQPKSKTPQSCSVELTQPQGFPPDDPTQQGHSSRSMRDLSFTAKAVKWLSVQAARQQDHLTKRLVLLVWAQAAQVKRHRRVTQALRLARVSESVSQKAAQQYQLLLLGWLSLRAHSQQRLCQNQHEKQCQSTVREERSQEAMGYRDRESEHQVQELIQLVEGLQKQVQARDDWCKHLERRSSEEQHKHTQELGALRQQIIELQEELKQKSCKDISPPAQHGDDKERQRVQHELDRISKERRQLQLLAAEHAKAKACAEEEQMRLQNELAANQERTRDLEHQLLLVDQQLVGILNQATAHGETPTGLTQLGPSPPLGTWALKKLQGMRETLRGIDGKEPLSRTAQTRRQPPLEAATFAPLQKLSQDSGHAEDAICQIPSLTEQQHGFRTLCQQRPTTPQYHHPTHVVQEAQASPPMSQLPESDLKHPQQQQAGPWADERRESSPSGYQSKEQQPGERQHADVQPEVGNGGDLKTAGEGRQQRLCMPQGAHILPRSQELKEHLNRQRTHRQQLLQQCAHPPQQTLYTQMNPHLQASFSSKFRDPQVAVQNYALCSFPLHLRQGTNPGPAMDHRFRGVSPQYNGRMTPSRMNVHCLGLNAT